MLFSVIHISSLPHPAEISMICALMAKLLEYTDHPRIEGKNV